jgi:hypothetical protein
MRFYSIVFGFAILLFSCAPSRVVRPLKKNEKVISANLGGPIVAFAGTRIPIPFTSIAYAHGLSNKTSAFGSVHTTSMLFGNFQTDLGVCHSIWKDDSLRLGLSVNPVINFVFDKWEKQFRFWPQVDLNFYYEFKPDQNFVYAGITNWIEPSSTRAHQQKQKYAWLPGIQLGYTHVKNKWNFTIEAKWLAPERDNKPNVVDYTGISGKGATGIYFGISRRLVKK